MHTQLLWQQCQYSTIQLLFSSVHFRFRTAFLLFALEHLYTCLQKATQQHKSRTHTHTYYSYCYVLSEQRKIGILCSSQIQLLNPSINNIYTLPSSQQSQFLIVSCIQLLHDCLLFTTQAFDITDRTSENTPRHPCLTRNTNICC